jgi:hypothetical protein
LVGGAVAPAEKGAHPAKMIINWPVEVGNRVLNPNKEATTLDVMADPVTAFSPTERAHLSDIAIPMGRCPRVGAEPNSANEKAGGEHRGRQFEGLFQGHPKSHGVKREQAPRDNNANPSREQCGKVKLGKTVPEHNANVMLHTERLRGNGSKLTGRQGQRSLIDIRGRALGLPLAMGFTARWSSEVASWRS